MVITTLRQIKNALEGLIRESEPSRHRPGYSFSHMASIIAMDPNIIIKLLHIANRISLSNEIEELPYTIERIISVLGLRRVSEELRKIEAIPVDREHSVRLQMVQAYCKAVLCAKMAERAFGTKEEAQKYFLAGLLADKLKNPTYKKVLLKSHDKLKDCLKKIVKNTKTDVIKDAEYLLYDFELDDMTKHPLEEKPGEFFHLWQETKKKTESILYKA